MMQHNLDKIFSWKKAHLELTSFTKLEKRNTRMHKSSAKVAIYEINCNFNQFLIYLTTFFYSVQNYQSTAIDWKKKSLVIFAQNLRPFQRLLGSCLTDYNKELYSLFVSRVGLNLCLTNRICIFRVPWGTIEIWGHWYDLCSRSQKPRTPSTPLRCIRSLGPKTNLGNLRRYYWTMHCAMPRFWPITNQNVKLRALQ